MFTATNEKTRIPERLYVKRVSVAGQLLRKNDREFRRVSRLVKIDGVEGFVGVSCLVESFPGKGDVVFFISMTQLQAAQFAKMFPGRTIYANHEGMGPVVIISWQQYSHLLWGRK